MRETKVLFGCKLPNPKIPVGTIPQRGKRFASPRMNSSAKSMTYRKKKMDKMNSKLQRGLYKIRYYLLGIKMPKLIFRLNDDIFRSYINLFFSLSFISWLRIIHFKNCFGVSGTLRPIFDTLVMDYGITQKCMP